MKLTDAKLRTLTDPGKHFDGGGLYLEVTKAGGRYWRLKYRHGGKEKRLAFGVYPAVTLRDARDRAAAARALLQAGDDPGALRKAAKVRALYEQENTLEAVALDWIRHQAARWEPVAAHTEGSEGLDIALVRLHQKEQGCSEQASIRAVAQHLAGHETATDPLLREPARRSVTGVSRSAWYALQEKGEAPKPVAIGARAVAWRASDLQKWVQARTQQGAAE